MTTTRSALSDEDIRVLVKGAEPEERPRCDRRPSRQAGFARPALISARAAESVETTVRDMAGFLSVNRVLSSNSAT